MPEPHRQLALELPHQPRLGLDDFLVSPANAAAVAALDRWPDWPDRRLMLLGPAGSGKSHLATIWAARSGASCVPAKDVAAEVVPRLAAGPALVIEDLDRGGLDEAAMFHLLNLVRERGSSLLLTAVRPPDRWGIRTPDLLSRLRLVPAVSLGAPDDALLRALLVKLFHDRQLAVDASVIEYVAARMERSFARAAALVAELDREGLSRGRRITRPIAAEILSRAGIRDED